LKKQLKQERKQMSDTIQETKDLIREIKAIKQKKDEAIIRKFRITNKITKMKTVREENKSKLQSQQRRHTINNQLRKLKSITISVKSLNTNHFSDAKSP
jgi:hypothetical protein